MESARGTRVYKRGRNRLENHLLVFSTRKVISIRMRASGKKERFTGKDSNGPMVNKVT
jgi:hypothetical protein